MKKISLRSLKREDVLSREELKMIMGGSTGSGENPGGGCSNLACSLTAGDGEGKDCYNDNKKGKCEYRQGIWGCNAITPC